MDNKMTLKFTGAYRAESPNLPAVYEAKIENQRYWMEISKDVPEGYDFAKAKAKAQEKFLIGDFKSNKIVIFAEDLQ